MVEETYSNEGPQCPYCERQYTADDSWYYDERLCTELECDECGKKFGISVHHSVSWTCNPVEPAPVVADGRSMGDGT